MSTTPLAFSDLTRALAKLNDDNAASNTAIANQLQELKQLLVDFSGIVAGGGNVSQADLAAAINQVESIDAIVVANTTAVNDASAAIVEATPNSTPPPITPVPPAPVSE